MGSTPVPVITADGMTKPLFSECLAYFEALFKGIYGKDLYWDPDDRDQQFMAQLAEALDDVNSSILSVFNGFSPTSAQKVSLSRLVKINGIARLVASYSSADVIIGGQAGTIIENGLVRDDESNVWALPAEVVIPGTGQILVTAVCTVLGAIRAPARTINQMATLVAGWQTVVNPTDATPGAPVETDAYLRARQTTSTALPSQTVLDKLRGALASVPGVSKSWVYENDTALPDERGIPAHSVAAVTSGGDTKAIASAIAQGKGSGVRTFGSHGGMYTNSAGSAQVIRYSRATQVQISYVVYVNPLRGYNSDVVTAIQKALSDWTNSLMYGARITRIDAAIEARLNDSPLKALFNIKDVMVGRGGETPSTSDLLLAYNEEAFCTPLYVKIRQV